MCQPFAGLSYKTCFQGLFLLICNYLIIFASDKQPYMNLYELVIMNERWYFYIACGVFAALLLWICDKFRIIKSKPLRIFVAFFVSFIICGLIYDLFIAPS